MSHLTETERSPQPATATGNHKKHRAGVQWKSDIMTINVKARLARGDDHKPKERKKIAWEAGCWKLPPWRNARTSKQGNVKRKYNQICVYLSTSRYIDLRVTMSVRVYS